MFRVSYVSVTTCPLFSCAEWNRREITTDSVSPYSGRAIMGNGALVEPPKDHQLEKIQTGNEFYFYCGMLIDFEGN